ncbi:MAG: PEP-CTERM sorting domain-containing protein [Planctomycetota bacterium]
MNARFALSTAALLGAGLVGSAASAQYFEVFIEATQNIDGEGDFLDTNVVDGNDVYAFSRGTGGGPAVEGSLIKVTGFGSNAVPTVATTLAQWDAASDVDLAGSNGAVLLDTGDLRFVNFFDNSVYDIDPGTGTVTKFLDSSVFDALVGGGPVSIPVTNTVLSDGSGLAYDSAGDQLLAFDNDGDLAIALNNAELTAISGNDIISGGMAVVGTTLYYGSNTSDELYVVDLVAKTGSALLTTAQIEAVTDDIDGRAGFGDIFAGPDGLIYFYETDSDYILSVDPTALDVAASVSVVLSEADLVAGPAGSDSVGQFEWYFGDLAWTSAGRGFYSLNVPEPATAALLGLGGLAMLRRRSA